MKVKELHRFLRRSSFIIRPARYASEEICDRSLRLVSFTAMVVLKNTSHGRRAFCGSFLRFYANSEEAFI